MIRGLDYFYDGQIYRYLEQIVRAYSGFKYMTGARAGQEPSLQLVPVRMAQTDRMVASILRNLSDNTLLSAPMITVYLTNISGRRADLQNIAHVDTRQAVERDVDDEGNYLHGRGKSYTIKRLMPLPMMLSLNVDIWTTNQSQKLQLLEQIVTATYPYFDIQNSNNALDWSALTTVTVRDDFTWSSRAIPIGTSDEIDIMTFSLEIPIWISPPAQVTQQTLIEQIVTNISDTDPLVGVVQDHAVGNLLAQNVTTPGNYRVRIEGNKAILINETGSETDEQGYLNSWERLINQYGTLRPAASQMILKNFIEEDGGVYGTLQYDPNDPHALFWQVDPDTLPANTLQPIDGIIDPMKTSPGAGLPVAANGQRYMILNDIGPSNAWGLLTAQYGDIIEYGSSGWSVSFDCSEETEMQYVLNFAKSKQMKWTGDDWIFAIDGEYPPGLWRLHL